jgi:tripartite-type tricarboxylate transporter receptor subunit TctC
MKRVSVALLFLMAWISHVHAQPAFYHNQTVRIVVGVPAGDVYDLWARLIAGHIGKHIPGRPELIVQNMPGAGSMIAANYVYGVVKPDGLTLGVFLPSLYFEQLLGRKEVQFDWAKYSWIGSPVRAERQMYMRADSPYKSIDDVRKAAEAPKCGATGTGSPEYFLPKLMEETLGAKFSIVTGYPGGQDIDLAVERGELHCRAFTIEAFFAREPFHTWHKTGFVRNIIQTPRKRDPRLADTPTIYELMDRYKTTDAGRRLATVVLAAGALGRPIAASPGIPSDRVKFLRDAFAKTMTDPEFLSEVKKRRYELEPVSGEEVEALAKEVLMQPAEVIERMKKLMGK